MGRAMKDINKTLKETKTMNFGTSAMPPPQSNVLGIKSTLKFPEGV
jgi:hypothetical protein